MKLRCTYLHLPNRIHTPQPLHHSFPSRRLHIMLHYEFRRRSSLHQNTNHTSVFASIDCSFVKAVRERKISIDIRWSYDGAISEMKWVNRGSGEVKQEAKLVEACFECREFQYVGCLSLHPRHHVLPPQCHVASHACEHLLGYRNLQNCLQCVFILSVRTQPPQGGLCNCLFLRPSLFVLAIVVASAR